jgi:hypothetical protein
VGPPSFLNASNQPFMAAPHVLVGVTQLQQKKRWLRLDNMKKKN